MKEIIEPLAILVASFSGAWAAFFFESQRRAREKKDLEIAYGNRAIYTVYGLWNVLEQYRREVLEPFRGRDDAWLNLAAHPAPPVQALRFDASDLQFLIDKGRAPVFATLLLEQQRFDLAIGLIKSRSDLVLNEVFPKMAAGQIGVGQAREQQAVERLLGIDVCHKLRQISAAIFTNVDEDLSSLRAAYTLLRGTLKELYPKTKFLEILFDESPRRDSVAA